MVWYANVWYNIVLWYGSSECYMILYDLTWHDTALLYFDNFPHISYHSLPLPLSFSPSSSIIPYLFLYHSLPLPLSFPTSYLHHSLPLPLSFPTSSSIILSLFLYHSLPLPILISLYLLSLIVSFSSPRNCHRS